MKSPLRIVFNNPKRTLQGWRGLFLHFICGQSKNRRLGAEGEPGKIQVSISKTEALFGVCPSPTSAPGGPLMRMKPSGQRLSRPITLKNEPTSLCAHRVLTSNLMETDGERGEGPRSPCLLLTAKTSQHCHPSAPVPRKSDRL